MENIRIVNHARDYLINLHSGVDPITDNKTDDLTICSVRVNRCFEFTAELLSRVAANLPDCEYDGVLHIPCTPNLKNEALIISRASDYMSLLGKGVDPVSGKQVEKTSPANDKKLRLCFMYVSDLMKKIKLEKAPFSVSEDVLDQFKYSDEPITPEEFTERINALVDTAYFMKLQSSDVINYLVRIQMIDKINASSGNVYYSASKLGSHLGVIDSKEKIGEVLFDRHMQDFIIKNITSIRPAAMRSSRTS
ncbi:MAG: hypothetical protein IIY78_01340 [Clostridia bacterium]|nr:hypothetical protein [Clostridia bacterium]